MFWKQSKKEKDEVWEQLIKILDIVKVEISELKKEVEGIQGKLRMKVYKTSTETEEETFDDGLDELRRINKA